MSVQNRNSPADLQSMGLHDMKQFIAAGGITIYNTLNNANRVDLLSKLEATDHNNFKADLQEAGGQAFASTTQNGKNATFQL